MSDYRVSGTDMVALADAIRAKAETTDSLEWPDGFVSAVGNISGGGYLPAEFSAAKASGQNPTAQATSRTVSLEQGKMYLVEWQRGLAANDTIILWTVYQTGSEWVMAGPSPSSSSTVYLNGDSLRIYLPARTSTTIYASFVVYEIAIKDANV